MRRAKEATTNVTALVSHQQETGTLDTALHHKLSNLMIELGRFVAKVLSETAVLSELDSWASD
eukprot:7203194-Pyramimonas_sp.AAC.1